jgi:hypothetical protein
MKIILVRNEGLWDVTLLIIHFYFNSISISEAGLYEMTWGINMNKCIFNCLQVTDSYMAVHK